MKRKLSFLLACLLSLLTLSEGFLLAAVPPPATPYTVNNPAQLRPGVIDYNVLTYNAKGNGSSNDSPPFTAAVTAATILGGIVTVPAKAAPYRLSDNVTVPADVRINFEPGAQISVDVGKTLTINGPASWFGTLNVGAGSVVYGLSSVHHEGGPLDLEGALKLGSGSYDAGKARLYTHVDNGTVLTLKPGSITDLSFLGISGNFLLRNPHGTDDMVFPNGVVTFPSYAASQLPTGKTEGSIVWQNELQAPVYTDVNHNWMPFFPALIANPRMTNYGAAGNGSANDAAALSLANGAVVGGGTLDIVPGNYRIGTNTTLGSSLIGIDVKAGAKFSVDNTRVLTLNSPITAPPTRIFDLSAGGTLSIPSTNPQDEWRLRWWGATGDGTTDDLTALTQAIASIGATTTTLLVDPGTYRLSNNITIPSNITLSMKPGAKFSVDSAKFLTDNGPLIADYSTHFTGSGGVLLSKVTEAFGEWFGALGDGTTDDSTAINKAITSGAASVRLLAKSYKLNTSLDLTGIVGPFTLRGSGQNYHPSVLSGVTFLLGNTGNVVLDIAGSQYITAEDLTIRSLNSYSNPSKVGILLGRSNVGGAVYNEFTTLQRLGIYMETSPAATAKGRIGIYNTGAEHFTMAHSFVDADSPVMISKGEVLAAIPSPHDGTLAVGTTSLLYFEMVGMRARSLPSIQIWGGWDINFNSCYVSQSPAGTQTYPITLNSSTLAPGSPGNIRFTGTMEEYDGIAILNVNTYGLDINVTKNASPAMTPGAYVNLATFELQDLNLRVQHSGGSGQVMIDGGGASQMTGGKLSVLTGQTVNASGVTLKGTLIEGATTLSAVTAHAGSNFAVLGTNGFESTASITPAMMADSTAGTLLQGGAPATFTSTPTLSNTNPSLSFSRIGSVSPAGNFAFRAENDLFALYRGTVGVDAQKIWKSDLNGTTLKGIHIQAVSAGEFTGTDTAAINVLGESSFATVGVGGGVGSSGSPLQVGTGGPFAVSSTGAVTALSATIGGGYGSTGTTLSSAGDIQANGTLTVDGASTLTGAVTAGAINGQTIANAASFVTSVTAPALIGSTSVTSPTVNAGTAGASTGAVNLSGATSGTVTVQGQAAAGTYNFNLPTTPGTSGQFLTSAAGGASPMTWTSPSSITAGAMAFSGLTGATNTTAAMVIGTGASLTTSGSGTINATSLNSATFAAPGAIGGTTASTGAFTTLTATATNPFLNFVVTGQVSPAGQYVWRGEGDALALYRGTLGTNAAHLLKADSTGLIVKALHVQNVSGGSLTGTDTAVITTNGNATVVSLIVGSSGTAVTKTLSATATLDFPSIAANSQQELTITVTGAATGDSVFLGPPSSLTAGLMWNGYVSSSGVVTVRTSNLTGSAIDPPSASWRASVIQF